MTTARPGAVVATARLPTLARWAKRPISDAAEIAFVLVVASGASVWLARAARADAAAIAPMAMAFAEVAVALGGASSLLRVMTGGRISRAGSLVATGTAIVAWIGLDGLHRLVFGEHLDGARLRLLAEGLRSDAVRWDLGLLTAIAIGIAAVALLLRALIAALTYVPRRERIEGSLARLRAPLVSALALLIVVDPCGTAGGPLRAPLPWARSAMTAVGQPATDGTSPVDGMESRQFARLERGRESLLSGPIFAEKRPSIVIIHAESVRFDMLRGDVMPNVSHLSRECMSPSHYYSTSNNTGSGMFGILAGLPVSYYALARGAHAKPLPLLLLKKLGYSLSVYYSSYLSKYDGLSDLFFKDVVDRIDEEPDARADAADAAIVDRYTAELATRDPSVPTFDYVVFESSHYDYAYPTEFEKFVPTATLGLGLRDALVVREGINDELKPRASLIRNRYQNAIRWTDSLIDRIVRAWASRRESVIFVVTGDHGEAFWEHGTFGHGLSLADEQVRVPLVMCIPGRPTTRYAYGSHTDIFPTIFDFMGLRVGGAFLVTELRGEPDRVVELSFTLPDGSQQEFRAKIVWAGETGPAGVRGFGVNFVLLQSETRQALARYLHPTLRASKSP